LFSAITNMISDAVTNFFQNLLESLVSMFTSFFGDEMAVALKILNTPYITNGIKLAQIIAGTLLALKVAAEALKTYILYNSGDSSAQPLELVKRTAFAAAMVSTSPWLVTKVYTFGADLAKEVAALPAVKLENPVLNIVSDISQMSTALLLILLAVIVIWILILIQTAIRAVEIAFIAVSGPIMAVGLTRPDEGVWSVWWRELVVLSLSQAVQTFMIRGFLSTIANMYFTSEILSKLMLIGWLWVAFKTPSVLRQFAYHSGVGGAVGQAAQSAGSMYIMRKMIMKG